MNYLYTLLVLYIFVTLNTPKACVFNIAEIAGKTPAQIAKKFGAPSSSETVKPSRTPCPCPKKSYLNGTMEIVFIKGKADWITLNVTAVCDVKSGGYKLQRHPDYIYVKAFTE